MQKQLRTIVSYVQLAATAAPGTQIFGADARRVGFTVSAGFAAGLQLIPGGVSPFSDLAFYNNTQNALGSLQEAFRRFCRCEYGDLVTGSMSAFSTAGNEVILVTETLEISE